MGEFSRLLAGVTAPAWVIAPMSGRILAATRAGWHCFGFDPDTGPADITLDAAMPACRRLAALPGEGQPSSETGQLVFWTPGGVVTPTCTWRRADSSEREPVLVVTATDPPGRSETEAAARARAPSEDALAAAAPLLAKLAHELRTPLGAIMSLAEIMRDERFGALGNPRYQEYAGDIFRSAHHALAVIHGMLSADDGQPGKKAFAFTEIDLGAIVSECVAMTMPMSLAASVTVETVVTPRLPRVIADARSVRQILLNLIGNAIKHTPQGAQVRVTTAYEPNGPVLLVVADDGPGMPAQELEQIMRDTTGQAPAPRPGGGYGIGLPLVRALANANGAELRLESRAGEGTTAIVTFAKDHVVPV